MWGDLNGKIGLRGGREYKAGIMQDVEQGNNKLLQDGSSTQMSWWICYMHTAGTLVLRNIQIPLKSSMEYKCWPKCMTKAQENTGMSFWCLLSYMSRKCFVSLDGNSLPCASSLSVSLPSGSQCYCSCCCCWGCQASGGCWSTKRQSTEHHPHSRPSGKPAQKIYDIETHYMRFTQW